MSQNDPDRLRAEAISVGLDELPDGSVAGATSFDDASRELFEVSTVDANTRAGLKAGLSRLSAGGNTYYDRGFEGAAKQLSQMDASTRKAVVFLSDGAPSDPSFTADRNIGDSGTPIYTIGFGDADQAVLASIAARSGGQTFSAASAADLRSIFAHIIATLTCAAPTYTSRLDMAPATTQYINFDVGLDDGEFRALAAWTGGKVTVSAVRPDGSEMSVNALRRGEAFADNLTYALLSKADPDVGTWRLKLVAPPSNSGMVNVTIDVFDRALPRLPQPPPLNVAVEGRHRDECAALFDLGRATTKKIVGGTEKTFDRAASVYQLCAGWGLPLDVSLTPHQKCAAVTVLYIVAGGAAGPAALQALDLLCGDVQTLNDLASGDYIGVAKSRACTAVGSLLATGTGLAAAIAAAETGPAAPILGTAVYRAVNASAVSVCEGLFVAGGNWLEGRHELHVRNDVASHGKCLRETVRLGYTTWSAADCPGGTVGGGGGGSGW